MTLPVQVAPVLRDPLSSPVRASAPAAEIGPAGSHACACLACGSTTCPDSATGCACNGSNQCVCTYSRP
jgi:hypothetical protein